MTVPPAPAPPPPRRPPSPRRSRAARPAAAALWLLPPALLVGLAWLVYDTHRIREPSRLSAAARAAVVAPLRAALVGDPAPPLDPLLRRPLPDRGPISASVWQRGRELVRVQCRGGTIADALPACADALRAHPALRLIPPNRREGGRIQVDVAAGRGPLHHRSRLLRAIGLAPGLDGLGVVLHGDRELVLLPADLVARRLLAASTPLSLVPELTLGLDFERADVALASIGRVPLPEYRARSRTYFRFRTDSFVEPPADRPGPPLPLTRGVPPAPDVTADALRAGALAGGAYLVAHLHESGRYIYERDLTSGRATDPARGAYSIPRHAGTTYFLAELYRHTGDASLREPIGRAIGHLDQLVTAGGCAGVTPGGARFACVVDRGERVAALGSTALAVVALAEHRRATGDGRHDALARALTEWLLLMQRPDGSFAHRYRVDAGERDEAAQLLYFSGEAALALARMHAVFGDDRYRDAAARALDHLIRWYDGFIGGFFYGEEHWTCIAAEAAWPALRDPAYLDFCLGYAAFLGRQQIAAGDFPDHADWAGAYGVTPFVTPANTPAGSRAEALISTYQLARHHGRDAPAVRRQIRAALGHALRQQVRADGLWRVPERARGLGAVPASGVDRGVRIDYVQHVCSAMIRGAELFE